MTNPANVLQDIQNRLGQSIPVEDIIQDLAPFTHHDASAWARRLPIWDNYRNEFPAQVVAVARVISRRAMREFGLTFDSEGRIIDENYLRPTSKSRKTFPMTIGEETVEVQYTPHFLTHSESDSFSFVGEPIPESSSPMNAHKPHALSDTGWWSQYASHDAVEAVGGPEAYAALLVEAILRGEDKKLEEVFDGKRPEVKQRKPKVMGEHTAAIAEEREDEQPKTIKQGTLF